MLLGKGVICSTVDNSNDSIHQEPDQAWKSGSTIK